MTDDRRNSRFDSEADPLAQRKRGADDAGPAVIRRSSTLKPAASAVFLFGAIVAATPVPANAAKCTASPEAGIDWSGCDRTNLMLPRTSLEGANLTKTDFSHTDLRGANLTSANLEKAALVRTSLAGATADRANFTKVEGYRSNLSGLTARGASFESAEFQRADFREADLTGSNFEKAELGRADFRGARLAETAYPMANLARADFSDAILSGSMDFTGAYLFLTRLEGVDLSAAVGLRQDQLELACGDRETVLPAGLRYPSGWPCVAD